jgi:superfamily II DNA or RNA helicase
LWLDPYFGGTCYELDYRRATPDGVISAPVVALVGVRFDPDERLAYDELTAALRVAAARLVDRHGLSREPYSEFMRQVAALANRGDASEGSVTARRYRASVLERRRLLADARAKPRRLAELAPAVAGADRTLIFTASIEASEAAAGVMSRSGITAKAIHSGLTRDARRDRLTRFASGELRVLAAPRVLDEGVDVPAADLAIVLGASRSRRQMVQRMGRLLRVKEDRRLARFAVLYVEGTVEDPAVGAHEGFLEQITAIAVAQRRFDASDPARAVNDFLCVTHATPAVPTADHHLRRPN